MQDIENKSGLTTVAPPAILKALNDAPYSGSGSARMASLAQEVVELQLLLYTGHKAKAHEQTKTTSLFDSVSRKIAESLNESENPEEDMQTILENVPSAVLQRSAWKIARLPVSRGFRRYTLRLTRTRPSILHSVLFKESIPQVPTPRQPATKLKSETSMNGTLYDQVLFVVSNVPIGSFKTSGR